MRPRTHRARHGPGPSRPSRPDPARRGDARRGAQAPTTGRCSAWRRRRRPARLRRRSDGPRACSRGLVAEGDTFYRGQEGGFTTSDVVGLADTLDALPGGRFAGITTFPTQLFDHARDGEVDPKPHNLAPGRRDAGQGRSQGHRDQRARHHVLGRSWPRWPRPVPPQVEPGPRPHRYHAAARHPRPAEQPAVVYLSEVSHLIGGEGLLFLAAAFYIDPVFPDYQVRAIVAREPTVADAGSPGSISLVPAMIDLLRDDRRERSRKRGSATVSSSASARRPSSTRALCLGVSGLASGNPVVEPVHDALGRLADWPV